MDLCQGVMGSGKSYYYVNMIYEEVNKSRKVFSDIYTNIDGFKFEEYENIHEYIHKDIYKIVEECYEMNVVQEKPFDEVLGYLVDIGFLKNREQKVLIIIDEAHNFFGGRKNEKLLWFITQHRHLYIDLKLITQKYTLIDRSYHHFNIVIEAMSPSMQISKKMLNYKVYSGLPHKDSLIENKALIKKQEVYDMYKSGDSVISKNIFTKYLIYILFFIFLFVGGSYFLFNSFSNRGAQDKFDISKNVDNNISNSAIVKSIKKEYSNLEVKDIITLNFKYLNSFNKFLVFDNDNNIDRISLNKFKAISKSCKIDNRVDISENNFYVDIDKSCLKYFNFEPDKNYIRKKQAEEDLEKQKSEKELYTSDLFVNNFCNTENKRKMFYQCNKYNNFY